MGDVEGAGSFGMVMPFVTVASKGGPHDDESYVAGYEMGGLDATLKALAPFTALVKFPVTIHAANRGQADLIAMKHGFTVQDVEWVESLEGCEPDPAWSMIVVQRSVAYGGED